MTTKSKDSWATPMPVYMAMDAEFNFKADICASDKNAKHPYYFTEEHDALSNMQFNMMQTNIVAGSFVWCNPPYSKIGPWVNLAIRLQSVGIGVVMLVMADSSVKWYYDALQHCSEIREVVRGRLSFINSEAGKPNSGNNKGSIFLIFHPFGVKGIPRRSYVTRDSLIESGCRAMKTQHKKEAS